MKTRVLFKSICILLLLPGLLIGSNSSDWKGKYTKEKTIKKEFKVNKDALVKIKNSYGNIIVVTNNGSTATFDILIKTNGNDEDKVQKKLDEIDVEFNATNSQVSAKTEFNTNKSGSWWSWRNNNKVSMEVQYRVTIPMTNSVDLDMDYGEINLDKLEGRATISCDYGKITTKELMGDNNSLSFDYTKNSYFEYVKNGKVNADYSDFTIAKAQDLEIVADYTDSKVEVSENISYNCDYGSLKINNVNSIKGQGDYLTYVLGNVYGDVSINQDYGSIRIEKLTNNAGNVNIESDYAGIEIGYDPGYNFQFDFVLDYGSLRGDSDLDFTRKVEKSTEKRYAGSHGNGGSKSITIKSDYGSVTLKKR